MSFFHIAIVFGIVTVTVVGDSMLKLGSEKENAFFAWQTQIGALLYALTAYGWVFMMQKTNLTVIATLYSVITIVVLTALSLWVFKESVATRQIVCAVLAVILVIASSR